MNLFKILEYSSFVSFVIGALLYLYDYTVLGSILLVLAIALRGIWVLKVKNVSDIKEEYKDVIDDNIHEK